jgi:hypothetical protein
VRLTDCKYRTVSSGRQHGAALIMLTFLLVLVATTVFFSSYDSRRYRVEREKITAKALVEAKAALIGRALLDANHPGSLPCPDSDNDGSAELFAGNHCPSYIGRLPWKTLGTGELRDAYGERLWYALSQNHRSAEPVNLDTPGMLTIDGVGDYLAIVFSAGPAMSDQSRPSNQFSDYLEGVSVDNNNVTVITSGTVTNDRTIRISRNEVQDKLASRILREIRGSSSQGLIHYYTESGENRYPFADTDGDGIADVDALAGNPSFEGPMNQSLYFEDDTKDMLGKNGWLSIINYQVSDDGQTVTLKLGNQELVVVP